MDFFEYVTLLFEWIVGTFHNIIMIFEIVASAIVRIPLMLDIVPEYIFVSGIVTLFAFVIKFILGR